MLDRLWDLFDRWKDDGAAEVEPDHSIMIEEDFGELSIHSGVLCIQSPDNDGRQEIPGIPATSLRVIGVLREYESGHQIVTGLRIAWGERSASIDETVVQEMDTNTYKVILADKQDLHEHWTETGPDRIGVILTLRNRKLLNALTKRFKLRTRQVHAIRAEIVGPVSESLEREINDYIETMPDYAGRAYIHFSVQTNNSFDRVNHLDKSWGYLSVGNTAEPRMLVCNATAGEGARLIEKHYAEGKLHSITIDFMAPVDD